MKLRIGTRKSPLAMWQAYETEALLKNHGYETEIVPISSIGDLKLSQPIYEIGVTGVFTKTLDIALLNNQIDIAVHSLKDVPTRLADGLNLTACLPRGQHEDILVYKNENIFKKVKRTIATGSLRRRAFWWSKYPQDEVVDLRGNVQLRLKKLIDSDWDGAIFAYAGLERSEILDQLDSKGLKFQTLSNMISAPSQGIVGVISRLDLDLSHITNKLAHRAGIIERSFLRELQGGCTAPIGGYAEVFENGVVKFDGAILSLDGKHKIEVSNESSNKDSIALGIDLAQHCIKKGADQMIIAIKKAMETGE